MVAFWQIHSAASPSQGFHRAARWSTGFLRQQEFPRTSALVRAGHRRAEAPRTITSFRLTLPLTRPPITAESVRVKLGVRQHKLSALHQLSHSLHQLTRKGTALALGDNLPSCFAAPEANL